MISVEEIAKLSSSFVFLSYGAGVIISHQTGSPFPAMVIAAMVSIVALLVVVITLLDNRSVMATYITIATVIAFSLGLMLFLFWFPPSFIGVDPDDYAVWVQGIQNTGNIESRIANFYMKAPLALLLPVIVTLITDIPRNGLWIFSIVLGVSFPLLASLFTRKLLQNYEWSNIHAGMVLAALLAGFTKELIRSGYWPVAQDLALVYFLFSIFILVSVSRYSFSYGRLLLPLILFVCAMILTHKLLPLLFFLSTITIVALHLLRVVNTNPTGTVLDGVFQKVDDTMRNITETRQKKIVLVSTFSGFTYLTWAIIATHFSSLLYSIIIGVAAVGLCVLVINSPRIPVDRSDYPLSQSKFSAYLLVVGAGVATATQWFIQTAFGERVVYRFLVPLSQQSSLPSEISSTFTVASAYVPGPIGIFMHRQSSLTIALFGAIVISILFFTKYRSPVYTVLLGSIGCVYLLLPLSITVMSSAGIGSQRLLINIIPVFSALLATVLVGAVSTNYSFDKQFMSRSVAKLVLVSVISIFLVFQIMSPGFALDYPGSSRIYLTSEEVAGKEHTNKYLYNNTAVATDTYYARESITIFSGDTSTTIDYHRSTREILNGTVKYNTEYIMFRPYVKKYPGSFAGIWQLNKNLEQPLDAKHSRVYSSNESVVYWLADSNSAPH